MNNYEIISNTIDQFSLLWSVKCALPKDTSIPVLDQQLKVLEIKLHSFGVNTDDLRMAANQ